MTSWPGRRRNALIAAVACCAAVAAALVAVAAAHSSRTGRALAASTTAAAGANLLANPGAQAGAFSVKGWDSVTVPGWQVTAGLPTVVRYGTRNFPAATGTGPAVPGGQMFAGGAGGTATLVQQVPLGQDTGQASRAGTGFRLSAWLGGTASSQASVRVTFLSAAGRALGQVALPPTAGLARKATAGQVPAGAAAARVTLDLATSQANVDGPDSPYTGYNRAVADDLQFSISAPARQPGPPRIAAVPRYQHVFLFYFENEGFHAIIGNHRQAPYLNSLLPQGSLLTQFYAEEHPSDGNYLALAGGSTFGVPLDDPLEINPRYTIDAPDIGDLVDRAHETWKTYLQSANGPCDDTVHGSYWDDDEPMTYFADVRDQPAYCSAHLVPLQALRQDLASTATTPSFAWVSPDDCYDMEGCGIRAGDRFLAEQLGEIMHSPAWRTQRSLAIITFDEDGYGHQHPAQRVPTIVLGSSGVRRGYQSAVRATHYSLLSTIEGALGLGTLTSNDRFAPPVSDVFGPAAGLTSMTGPARRPAGRSSHPANLTRWPAAATARSAARLLAAGRSRAAAVDARAGLDAGAGRATGPPLPERTAFVANAASGTVTPVTLATGRAGQPIRVGKGPRAIAVTPNGRTALVVNSGSGTVTPIDTLTRRAGAPIRVGADPRAVAITPDGRTALVTSSGSGTVTPVDIATLRAGPPIPVGTDPRALAITPDGRTALVADWGSAQVTPVSIASRTAGPPIPVGAYPSAITLSPGGRTAYVANYGADTVTPVSIAARRAGRAVPAGQAPDGLAVSPDGRTLYVTDGDTGTVTPVSTASWQPGRAVRVGYSPAAVAASRAGMLVVSTISGTLTPVSTSTGRAGRPVSVGTYGYPTAIAVTSSGRAAVVLDTYSGQIAIVGTAPSLGRVKRVKVGKYPVAAAFGA